MGKKCRPYALDYIVNAQPNEQTKFMLNFCYCKFDVRVYAYMLVYQCQGEVRIRKKAKCMLNKYHNRYYISFVCPKCWFTEKGTKST